jgi:hypothetical protein
MSHPCRIASCTRPAKDGQLMCWPHWRGLPRRLKDANVAQAVELIDEKEGRA